MHQFQNFNVSRLVLQLLPRELCQFSVHAISGYAWHICVKYRLLLIEWESVCEMPIGRSCDWYTSPKRELGDVGTTAGHNCVTLVWMLYLDIRGAFVLNIDCYWLNERVCVKCPLVRAVTDTRHLMPPLHSSRALHDVSTISKNAGVHRSYSDLNWSAKIQVFYALFRL